MSNMKTLAQVSIPAGLVNPIMAKDEPEVSSKTQYEESLNEKANSAVEKYLSSGMSASLREHWRLLADEKGLLSSPGNRIPSIKTSLRDRQKFLLGEFVGDATVTGRFSSSNPQITNIPNPSETARPVGRPATLGAEFGGKLSEGFVCFEEAEARDIHVNMTLFFKATDTVTDSQGRERHPVTLIEKGHDGFDVKITSIRDTLRGL